MTTTSTSGSDRAKLVAGLARRVVGYVRYRVRITLHPPADVFDIGDRLTVGRHTYGRPKVRWYEGDTAGVSIGNFTSIADDVVFAIGGGHPLDRVSLFPFRAQFGLPGAFEDGHPTTKGDIVVGSDVWIGRGARVMSGVTIGHGAVIGAYSVVARDVRPYAIVVGNPARELRRRFDDDTIGRLLALAWWDWPDEQVLAHVDELTSSDVERFISEYSAAPTNRAMP